MVPVIKDKILNHLGAETVPLVVVGNKTDIKPQMKQVTPEEGKKLAEELGCAWTEASARLNENVGKSFELLIAEIEKQQNPNEPPGGGKCTVM
ncbi:putative rheb small monomeric gtpase [Phaeomoniella chlamydospora]|uniref:Putative rheb small monomeric gtpase n=1 Tax=Phaeomoniella chlamydospora TaxID=158046 RepID=A0A0G2ETL8_PHACM|nr:putative rheb small monomeric gtpase [Phaeomoniella chlamydospora]